MYCNVPRMVPCAVSGALCVASALSPPTGAIAAALRQPKVQQLGALVRQHDVAGLQVAVHDLAPMRFVQGVGDFGGVAQDLVERERSPGEPLGQGLPVQILHHEVVGAILLADIEDRTDVRVAERGQGPRFALEAVLQV